MIGTTLSHFRILAKLGEGGMGVVYRAEDTSLRRPVALKVLPPERVGNEERRLRFLREARAAAAVTHPNIATIYEVGEEKGVVFIAMELVEGKTLRAHMAGRPLPIKEALRIAAAITEGLSRAHNARVIHRDLKPDNIMVAPDGHLKILDFGLAKLLEPRSGADDADMSRLATLSGEMTQAGKIVGTVAYMSPEQARGEPVDARSDLFSFGIILYEIVTGTSPFQGRTPTDLLSAIIKDRPAPAAGRNPDVPPELERLIEKCLEKDPADRYQHADEIVVDLKRLRRASDSEVQAVKSAAAEAVQARPGAGVRLARTLARRPILAGALALVLVAAGAGTWALLRPPAPFREGEAVIVADFENATGAPELDSAVRDAFEERLTHSTFLEVIRGEQLKDLLSFQAGTGRTRLTVEVANRLCGGGQCAGIAAGKIDRQGTGFRIEAALKRPGSKRTLVTSSGHAASEKDLLKAIHEAVLELRRLVGESPKAVSSTYPPTTDSLPAYQAYATAVSLEWTNAEALALVDRALTIDPGFVDAYSTGTVALQNMGRWREARKYAERARESASRFPDQVRLLSEILLVDVQYDHDRELELLRSYRRLYPFERERANWIGWVYLVLEDPAAAEEHLRAAYELKHGLTDLALLQDAFIELGKPDEIGRLNADYEKYRGRNEPQLLGLISQAYARRDWKAAVEVADRTTWDSGPEAGAAVYERFWSRLWAGRFSEAREKFHSVRRMPGSIGDLDAQLNLAMTHAWLEMQRGGEAPPLAPELIANVGGSLHRLPRLATFCIEAGVAEPLEQALRLHEEIEKDSKSAYVREQLEFARGSLALIRGDAGAARALLEPVVRARGLKARHHALAKTYEALEMWPEAVAEYRQVVESVRVFSLSIPALWAIDHFRLARAYERMGDPARAREWYERFLTEWKDADPDIPEVVEARRRLSGN